MSYQHGWKGGWQNDLLPLLQGSLLWKSTNVCVQFGFNSVDVEASTVLRSQHFLFYRHRLKRNATSCQS